MGSSDGRREKQRYLDIGVIAHSDASSIDPLNGSESLKSRLFITTTNECISFDLSNKLTSIKTIMPMVPAIIPCRKIPTKVIVPVIGSTTYLSQCVTSAKAIVARDVLNILEKNGIK